MKNTLKIYIISMFIVAGCASWKSLLHKEGGNDEAIENAICDFLNSSALYKKDEVFSIRVLNINKNTLGVSITGTTNKLFPTPINKIGSNDSSFPTKYIESKNKLFIWNDSDSVITKELILKLSQYNHIDSTNVNGIVTLPEYIIDDSKEGIDYYFCKDNLTNYKKIRTSLAMGWYDCPNLKCK